MNDMPKVSICIPTYNRSKYLNNTIQSALAQHYPNIEVIVSDNASTDDTLLRLAAVHDSRLIVLKQSSNIGMANNWNACLNRASGEYFILLSDDDWLEPAAIQKMVELFKNGSLQSSSNDDIGIVCCRAKTVNESDTVIGLGRPAPFKESAESLIISFFNGKRDMYPCKILFRTEDVRSVGGYPGELFPVGFDAYMWMMIVMKRGYSLFVDECLSTYRIHELSSTNNTKYDIWIKDTTALGSICCDYFKSKAMLDVVNKINNSMLSWNCRLVAGTSIALTRVDKSYSSGINCLIKHKRIFLSNKRNLLILLLTIIKIALPVKVINIFRPIYNHIRCH